MKINKKKMAIQLGLVMVSTVLGLVGHFTSDVHTHIKNEIRKYVK